MKNATDAPTEYDFCLGEMITFGAKARRKKEKPNKYDYWEAGWRAAIDYLNAQKTANKAEPSEPSSTK